MNGIVVEGQSKSLVTCIYIAKREREREREREPFYRKSSLLVPLVTVTITQLRGE